MYTFVIVLTVIVSILLIGLVLIQKSKGGGLSSQFGNVSGAMGVQQTNTFLEKGTWWLISIIVVLSICSSYLAPSSKNIKIKAPTETSVPGTNQFDANTQSLPVNQE